MPPSQVQTPPSAHLSTAQKMQYRIGRGEMGVMTFEPYKSEILPLWRFKTPDVATISSRKIYEKFLEYDGRGDFVGMDMCRKFLQMGMTRATRYANHAGGRKYAKPISNSPGAGSTPKEELPKSTSHPDRQDKLEAAAIFREAWEKVKGSSSYVERKEQFIKEQKEWDKSDVE
ncbi:unnamed protein product [Periconia digitata]|uniref:Uncharacterized protein n=1 Tax=Periconia digitata TaxID=1303443 RepID=A0A9W4UTU0_9PLEO|nr:unnamed protein product [Periconia digitata]